MNVEFLCRFLKQPSRDVLDEIDEYLHNQKLIRNDFDVDHERNKLLFKRDDKYEYSPLSFDLKDVKMSNSADDEHTYLRFYGGEQFVIKCDYETFKNMYQFFNGSLIHNCNESINFKPMKSNGEQSIFNKNG